MKSIFKAVKLKPELSFNFKKTHQKPFGTWFEQPFRPVPTKRVAHNPLNVHKGWSRVTSVSSTIKVAMASRRDADALWAGRQI